ncbi:FmdB family transcriptional regulator [Rhodococcus sp. BP-349]|uniref:FmdB family zinc ribbon protein n=1 Tax=unclassified Rhodococcus (in: high G+C Gram-positive bacteria) TaxID=192944 RepID=UPI001C9A5453|nr:MULTISPECIES: FmdB family zinc ribbon protein [unclassified Rhodococcus (in: high G+C Gram-positive bacteria)]MBY6538346.1 FmdB family transcriptional regulator [Rhodococcus sp. BP-363]MBY6542683.1 FmdB family transcriptional regulator [Rhodococcus sp. BP-369]MBY6561913.1 FmdB family transcriptional regulator [Rhodococcus sp. BP-370]MBY6576205.1 FmdB family transcriptional regulator [Rhodococcus sp. BP-364]MBY6585506.1 FmdB family transcriptional regulator [Rhodococcus sp. BP-358]
MPTYSYACTECDNRFDIVQKFTDDSLTVCPACSGKLRKLFNTVGIVFKGSGFYRNDSRGSSSSSESGSSDSGSSSDSKGSSEKKSETKSDSTSSTSSEKKSSEKKSTSTSTPAAAS